MVDFTGQQEDYSGCRWIIFRVHKNQNPSKISHRESIDEIKYVEIDEFSVEIFIKRKYVLFREIYPSSCGT